MTRRRWIADSVEGDRAVLIGQNAHHLARVLRAQVGQEFDVVCGGAVRLGRIASISDEQVTFDLGAQLPHATVREITLLLAVFKFDRFEWAIEKATELGVTAIQPVIAQRTDVHLAAAAAKRVERWRRLAHEASQQSRRIAEPVIHDPVKLKDFLAHEGTVHSSASKMVKSGPGEKAKLSTGGARILLSESETERTLAQSLPANSANIALAVGPEGGWTNDELEQFVRAGWISASLGPTILRAETATIAALAISASLP